MLKRCLRYLPARFWMLFVIRDQSRQQRKNSACETHQDGENPAVAANRHCLRRPQRQSVQWSIPICPDPARWAQTTNLASPAPAKTARSSEFSEWAHRADALATANEAA